MKVTLQTEAYLYDCETCKVQVTCFVNYDPIFFMKSTSRVQCCKTFYVSNLRMFVISQSVCSLQHRDRSKPIQPSQIFTIENTPYLIEAPIRSSTLGWAPGLTYKHQARLDRPTRDKQPSLLRKLVNFGQKSFNHIEPRGRYHKTFNSLNNKLECSSLASLSRIVWCLWVSQEPTQVKHLSGAPLQGRLLALPTSNRLGWKSLPGTNIIAYYENL